MFFPVIPVLSSVAVALGGYGLYWYHNLTKDEQEAADRLAAKYAMDLYGKGLDRLTKEQFARVNELVKASYAA